MAFSITSIPRIMRHRGWDNGARLMEIWFSRGSATNPAYGPPDTQTIRMSSWALTFPRAKDVYDKLIRERIWANAPAQQVIGERLRAKGLLTPGAQSMPFGNLSAPVPILDREYINYRSVGSPSDPLDDLSAALHMFVFRVVVAGGITPIPNSPKFHITISEVGVYILDQYEFNGYQPLGTWDDATNSVSINPTSSGTSVSNSDFRDWRDAKGRGGDFLVFSDLLVTRLSKPDEFDI